MTRKEVEQMGRILANYNHEMRNVLAVVRTSTGLIQDIQGMGKKGLKFADKVEKALEKIDRQSKRGVELSKHSSDMAHACDRTESTFSPHDLADNAAWLMHRLASQAEIELTARATQAVPEVTGDRIRYFLAVTFMVDACLAQGPAGSSLVLSGGKKGDSPTVTACFEGADGLDPATLARGMAQGVEQVFAELGVNLDTLAADDGGPGLRLVL